MNPGFPKKLLFVLLLVFAACSKNAFRLDTSHQPLLRVGLLQHQNQVYFVVGGPFSIFRKDGKFIVRVLKGHRWRADIVDIKPAVIEYRLRYWMTSDHKLAFEKSHELAEKNLRPEILQFAAGNARWKLTRLRKMIYHVVLWRIFDTREAAEAMQKQLAAKVHLEVMPVTKVPAGGTIEITNLESSKRWRFPSGSRIVTDRFALLNVPVGEGFHWENRRDEVFRGNLELLIDQEKKLTAVDELPLESYLRGVVPSEMHANFPLEALKAQAIAARSQVLVNAGRKHLDEDFDVCATVHCQVYSGMMKEAKSTDRAIKETTGLVLFSQSQIVEGVYSGVCGGQTENNENVWNGNPMPHLRGVFDGEGPPGLLDNYLQDEARLRRWIAKRPPVFCNTLDAQVPEAMVYTRKYFRWQQTETRLALSGYIRQATGENFGQLKDILPLERGVSGRLRRIRIVGTLKTFEIEKELNIRRALSRTVLYSSCFVIDKKMGANGLPETFTFRGAGWGHGVGMCQTGAAMMALKGYTFEEILKHYYQNIEVEAVY